MAYADARDRIVTVLEGVTITTPEAKEMARVYTSEPRESTHETPCVVLGPWARPPSMHPGLTLTAFVQQCELRLVEHDRDRLIDYIEAWQDAIETAFEADQTLNGNAASISLPEWDFWSGESGVDGSPDTAVCPFTLTVRLAGAVTRAA